MACIIGWLGWLTTEVASGGVLEYPSRGPHSDNTVIAKTNKTPQVSFHRVFPRPSARYTTVPK